MTTITASMVKELRERTGAGMMDCKKALSENNGDIEASIDWLRKKGLASAAKKAGRTAAEGLVGVYTEINKGAIVEVNSETDFVARNEKFQSFVSTLAKVTLDQGGEIDALKIASYPTNGRTVEEELTELISTIGENMVLRRSAALKVQDGVVVSYLHNVVSAHTGRIGVLVALESSADKYILEQLGKQIAMHVAATNPQSTTVEDLDPDLIEKERSVLIEQAKESGKPVEFIEKMVEGRLRKYYEQVVLNEQEFVMNPDMKVKDIIAETAKEAETDIKLSGFVRFALGEGIEKEEKDFASEVAAQLGN